MPWWQLVLGAEPDGAYSHDNRKSWVWHLTEYPTHWQTDSFRQTTEVIKLEKLILLQPLLFLQDKFLLSFFWVFNLQNIQCRVYPSDGEHHVLFSTYNWNSAQNTDLIFLWSFSCESPIAVPANFVKSNEYFFHLCLGTDTVICTLYRRQHWGVERFKA